MARHRDRGWELPGGRLRAGEDAVIGALREFEEEIGHSLHEATLALTQKRPNGICHVVTGLMGPPIPGYARSAHEKIAEWRFVTRLGDLSPLAFPEDPYAEIEAVLGARLL
ncbi:MAG: NUDIX domain-containing protein [Euryarchaeota archaeon]|nr:NUDIX domain-containing protein [Euryarchaeota archaeon]